MIATVASPVLPRERVIAADLLIGCVTEDEPKYLAQALRLVQSIRWFGGELAGAAILVCAVESIGEPARRALEELGAEVRVVERFPAGNPSANKLQLFAEALGFGRETLLLLDCDTVVVRDPLPWMRRGVVQAKIAHLPSVTSEVFARLFDHFGLPLPPPAYVNAITGTPTIRYCNSGVVLMPADVARRFVPVWRDYNLRLAAAPALAHPCERHVHQASLTLAFAACPVPFAEAPEELNYQLNQTHREPPAGFLDIDPAILHYHGHVDVDGYLRPVPYPLAQARIESFNRRLREERGKGSPQVVVLGMHRSGTSAVTRVLNMMGLWLGPPDSYPPADAANPTGYWELRDVWALDEAVLAALGTEWWDAAALDVERLGPLAQRHFVQRARHIVDGLDRGGPWVIKDPRLCVLFPLWRRVLERPVCILVHRDPLAVARSLQERDGLSISHGIALWELYNRQALTASLGLPRILVSYRELVDAPEATAERLRRELTRLAGPGAAGLSLPSVDELRAFVAPALDRHPGDPELEGQILTAPQLELRRALADGSALDLDPVPPLSAPALDLLSSFSLLARSTARSSQLAADREAAERRIDELDRIVDAILASRSWKIGSALTTAFRKLLGRPAAPTAAERRESLMDAVRRVRARRE